MTKKELIELLEQLEDNDEVFFSYPSGDYWHTIIVKPVINAQLENVSYNGYHESLVLEKEIGYDICEEDEDYDNKEGNIQKFVLG